MIEVDSLTHRRPRDKGLMNPVAAGMAAELEKPVFSEVKSAITELRASSYPAQ